MIKAVIFDRDGVLVDSEVTNVKTAERVFGELGIILTDEEKSSIVGHHPADYLVPFVEKYDFDYDKFRERQREVHNELLKDAPTFEKTIELLKGIHKAGLKVALCTSSKREQTDWLLEKLGISDLFEVIVAKEDCTKRKPAPEPYLLTAEKLGVKPEECLVIEDSEPGAKSAVAAGTKCLVIFNDYTKDHDFSGAWKVIDSADKIELNELLKA